MTTRERRQPIPAAALRAAYTTHRTDTHPNNTSAHCRTCRRYAAALIRAHTRDQHLPA